MRIGTKSILFGAHQFLIHPLFVAIAWWKLYGFPWDPRLWFAFFLHDIGYRGKPNMDGPQGNTHPYKAAIIMHNLFKEGRWYRFCLYHSRFLADHHDQPYSKLCFADKLSMTLEPSCIYLPRVILTGEIKEYMELTTKGIHTTTKRIWFRSVCKYLKRWVKENNHENV